MPFCKNNLLVLFHYLNIRKRAVFFAVIFSVFNKICDILPEILLAIAVDVVVRQHDSVIATKIGLIDPHYQLYFIATITTIIWLLESLFEYLYYISWRNLGLEIKHNLRLLAYEKIQSLDLAYIENETIGNFQLILQEDVAQIEDFIIQIPNAVIALIVNITIISLFFLTISPSLFIYNLISIPFILCIDFYFQHKLSFLYDHMRDVTTEMMSNIIYRLQGLVTIKAYCTESYETEHLRSESEKCKQASNSINRLLGQYIPLIRIIIIIGFIITMIIGGIKVLNGEIAIYWYAELVFLIQRFLWPFASLTTIADMYKKTSTSAHRIVDLLQVPITVKDCSSFEDVTSCSSNISFQNVSFMYDSGKNVLTDLTFTIPQKSTVAFVGQIGSGKSTISKILLRFYDIDKGSITIGNHNIKDINIHDLRSMIGLVNENIYVIDGTIAENIRYGNFQATRKDIILAASMAHIHDFIISLPKGYDTHINEYAKKLSAGQKQSISIARALLKKPCIFIFDKATSALDNETEAEINESISRLKSKQTIIIITNKLSAAHNADIIFVLDKGHIVESGTHKELLEKKGMYAKLWNIQIQ